MHGTMEQGGTLVTAGEAHGIFTPRTLRRALLYLLVVVVALVIVVPLLWMVSTCLIISQFGMQNAYWAVLLPGLGSAFGVFCLRQFFLGLPTEMEEAMLIDGASRWRILWSMVVPLSKGALATLFVLSLLASW